MIRLALLMCFVAAPLMGETIVAARTIPAQTILTFEDLILLDKDIPGGTDDPFQLVGKESRVALFEGRAVRPSDVSAPAIIERNQIIPLIYQSSELQIKTDGRALDRAGVGDVIEVMNLGSRTTVLAEIGRDGAAYVGDLR